MRSPHIPMWARLTAALIVTIAAAAGCSSSASSSTGTATAAGGTGNTVNPTWPTEITYGAVGESNATSLLQTLAPLQKLLQDKMDVKLNVVTGMRRGQIVLDGSPRDISEETPMGIYRGVVG